MLNLLDGLGYLWMIIFIMISAGLAKEHDLFAPAYAYVRNVFRSNKFVLVILSAIGGVLPISGRVTVSAGLLDTLAPKSGPGREKLGIIDYLATHHYYMWSPLEKTVILPIAAFGLTYTAWLGIVWPILISSFLFIGWYVWSQVKEDEVAIKPTNFNMPSVVRNVFPMIIAIAGYIKTSDYVLCFGLLSLYYIILTATWDIKKLINYVNFELLFTVAFVIILSNYLKSHEDSIQTFVTDAMLDPTTLVGITLISLLGFTGSFIMGSSGKFIALAVLMSQVFGIEYFLWFFALEYSAYLCSPMHKCLVIGRGYFNTPLIMYYKALTMWIIILLVSSGIATFAI
jgi:hypothetical protein